MLRLSVQLALTRGRKQQIKVVTALGFSLMILKEAHSCPMQEDAEVPRVFEPPAYTASNIVSVEIAIATLMQIDSEKLNKEKTK